LVDIFGGSSSSLVDIIHHDIEDYISQFFRFFAIGEEHTDIDKCTKTKHSQYGSFGRDMDVLTNAISGFL